MIQRFFKEHRKAVYTHLLSVVIIVAVNVIYFYPQLEGKKLKQGDIISSVGQTAEFEHYKEKTGKLYLWTNGHFSGLPRLLGAPAKNNLITPLYKVFRLGFKEPIGLFIAMMLMAYFMFVILGVNPWLGLILSIGLGLTTGNLQLWSAGHNSKIRTLAFTPLIIAGVLLLFEKHKYWLGALVLTIGLTLSIWARHPQMTYYLFVVFVIYGVIKLIEAIKINDLKSFLMPVLISVVCAILAVGASASKLWSLYDYNQSSMRGKPVLTTEKVKNTEATSSSEVKGLDWNYAMQWSNNLVDLLSSYIPGFAGGGSGEKVSTNSETYRAYRIQRAPLYWGGLPFTEGPMYFGAVLVFLFVFGMFYLQGNLKVWLGIAVILTALMSMGKHFEFFNKLLFDYLPMYNNFRTPQSILSVTVFLIPVLGAVAVNKVIEARSKLRRKKKTKKLVIPEEFKKSLYWSTGICAGFALLMAILGPSLFSFESAGDARMAANGMDLSPIISDRKSLLQRDAFRTFILVMGAAAALWFFLKKSISKAVLLGILGLLVVFDIWTVGQRYLEHSDFVTVREYEDVFTPRPVDEQILAMEDAREDYRVLDATINTFNSTSTSVFHNTIGGYHPAKLQRYQDIIERYISTNNMQVLNMLNTKYFIVNGNNGQPTVQSNPGALGHAWFVDHIRKVGTPNEEISALGEINTAQEAVVLDSEFGNYIGDFDPNLDPSASITLTDYEPDHLTYQAKTSTDQLAVFSEIWYGPNRGWQAYLNGEPVEHIRTNYILRAMKIPSGEHKIEFIFKPKSYYLGEKISLVFSLIIIVGLIFTLYRWYKDEMPSLSTT